MFPIPLYTGRNIIKVDYGQFNWPRSGGRHIGSDVSTPDPDKRIRCQFNGPVEFSGSIKQSTGNRNWEWGNHVRQYINQTDTRIREGTIRAVFAHNESNLVRTGQVLTAGQFVGVMGATGNAVGSSQGLHCHVQYDKCINNTWVPLDPTPFIGGSNKAGVIWHGSENNGDDTMRSLDTPGAGRPRENGRPWNIQGFSVPDARQVIADNLPNDRYMIVEGETPLAGTNPTLQCVRIWNHRMGMLMWVALLGTGVTEVHSITPEQMRDRLPAWLANSPNAPANPCPENPSLEQYNKVVQQRDRLQNQVNAIADIVAK